MKAKMYEKTAVFCLAFLSSTISWSDPLICVDSVGARMEYCPAFLTMEDWGDICTVYHDGERTRGFGCTDISADEALSCLYVSCVIRESENGCEGSVFDDGPCIGHQNLVEEFKLFDLINEARVGAELPEVQYHPIASNVVEAYAEFVCARDGCDQDAGENCHRLDGKSGGDRLNEAGVSWLFWCENLAFGYTNAQAALDGWMVSTGHRECLLDETGYGTATHAGAAHVACTTAPDIWITILFRSPSDSSLYPMRKIRPSKSLPFKWYPLTSKPKLKLPPMDNGVRGGSDQKSLPSMESDSKVKW